LTANPKRLWPALCVAAVLLAILLANPFTSTGFDDDWSYARVALKFAQTGRLQYNGWGSPLQLVQTLWATPWIRLFGFSFPLVQATTIPFSLGFVLLVYATGRQVGLSRELSAFASIGTGTSPLFLPFAASFMTEACACFFGMACILCALRALEASDPGDAARWLWALAFTGLLGGADRQSVWAAPLALIPCIAWRRRHEAVTRRHSLAAFAGLLVAIAAALHWLSPPYVGLQIDRSLLGWLLLHKSVTALQSIGLFLMLAAELALPAFALCLPKLRRERRLRNALIALAIPALTLLELFAGGPVAPYGNNAITALGIDVGQQNNTGVVILPVLAWLTLTGLTNVCAVSAVVYAVRRRWEGIATENNAAIVFGAFTLSYLALLIPAGLTEYIFDRYTLPLVPPAFLAVLMAASRRRSTATPFAWAGLVLFAWYGVGTTHDYAAAQRAKVAAAHALEKSGVDRARLSAAFEYDAWGQLERSEYARGTRYSDHVADDSAKGFWFELWDHLADLHPDYVVLNATDSRPPRVGEFSVGYSAWIPPFHRYIVVWKRADLTAELEAARMISETRP
jgi:hypothetical protein